MFFLFHFDSMVIIHHSDFFFCYILSVCLDSVVIYNLSSLFSLCFGIIGIFFFFPSTFVVFYLCLLNFGSEFRSLCFTIFFYFILSQFRNQPIYFSKHAIHFDLLILNWNAFSVVFCFGCTRFLFLS